MEWMLDSKNLLILGDPIADGSSKQKLILFNIETMDSYPILPNYSFGGGANVGQQIALSKDGKTLAVKCPVWDEVKPLIISDQICLISIYNVP